MGLQDTLCQLSNYAPQKMKWGLCLLSEHHEQEGSEQGVMLQWQDWQLLLQGLGAKEREEAE